METAVNKSFKDYQIDKLANVFLTLHSGFEGSMNAKNRNNFQNATQKKV